MTNEEAGFSTEPDACFISRQTLRSKRVRLVPLGNDESRSKELAGTPDWVLEIVRDSSARKDTCLLRQLYFRAGIPEYWLIDARGVEIVFHILLPGSSGYEEAEVKRGGWQMSPVFQRRFRLSRRKNRVNLWEYTLQVKPLR